MQVKNFASRTVKKYDSFGTVKKTMSKDIRIKGNSYDLYIHCS